MELFKHIYHYLNNRFGLMERSVSKISVYILLVVFSFIQKDSNAQTQSNITISTSVTSGGVWSGNGSDPLPARRPD